jgi:hypothetical protein
VEQGFARYRTKSAKFWHYLQQSSQLSSICILPWHHDSSHNKPRSSYVTWLWWGPDESTDRPLALRELILLILMKEAAHDAQWWSHSA